MFKMCEKEEEKEYLDYAQGWNEAELEGKK